jgi:hypothetical protein
LGKFKNEDETNRSHQITSLISAGWLEKSCPPELWSHTIKLGILILITFSLLSVKSSNKRKKKGVWRASSIYCINKNENKWRIINQRRLVESKAGADDGRHGQRSAYHGRKRSGPGQRRAGLFW